MFNDGEMSTDYSCKCGNCQEWIGEEAKYCPFCGTKRGEGKFEPYENIIACVYGPPHQTTFFCSECNHKWGSSETHIKTIYCPNCKSEVIQNWGSRWGRFPGDSLKLAEKGKQVLTMRDVSRILGMRRKPTTDQYTIEEILSNNGYPEAKASIEFFETAPEEDVTKVELEHLIMRLHGRNMMALRDYKCPNCESNVIAAIAKRDNHMSLKECDASVEYVKAADDQLYYEESYSLDNLRFRCLQCGIKF